MLSNQKANERYSGKIPRYRIILILAVLLAGCSTAKTQLPTVLSAKDVQWTIPKGVTFKAIQRPAFPNLTEFVVPDDDLVVLYKGSLLDLEKDANKRAARGARASKRDGAVLGAIGSLLTLLAGLFGKKVYDKKKEE